MKHRELSTVSISARGTAEAGIRPYEMPPLTFRGRAFPAPSSTPEGRWRHFCFGAMPITVECENCGQKVDKSPCYVERSNKLFCDNTCKIEYQKKERHPRWSEKGAFDDGNGYIYIRIDGEYVYEHRWVAEQMLGRTLKDDEVVHHINGDKKDNRWPNLRVMGKDEHSSIHSSGEGNPRSKLTKEEVRRIREIYSQTDCYQKDLAERFGVAQTTISRIVRGDSWT